LVYASHPSSTVHPPAKAIQQVEEALEIFEQLGDTMRQVQCLCLLTYYHQQDQANSAEITATRGITLLPPNSKPIIVYECHSYLGLLYRFTDSPEKAIEHFEIALGIASSHNWHGEASDTYGRLIPLFVRVGRIDDANAHLAGAKLHAVNNAKSLAHVMLQQAEIFHGQGRFVEAKSEGLRAREAFEKIGAAGDAVVCGGFLAMVEQEFRWLPIDTSNSDASGN